MLTLQVCGIIWAVQTTEGWTTIGHKGTTALGDKAMGRQTRQWLQAGNPVKFSCRSI